MAPLISVIVPVYNVEKYIRNCVDSIIAQSYTNLEIILVDDGSKDECSKIIDDYRMNDTRIKVVHKKNGGLSSARNTGLDMATGEYIMFVDSDDYIQRNMIQLLYDSIKKHGTKLSMCGLCYVGETGERIETNLLQHDDELWSIEHFWKNVYSADYPTAVVAWCKLYRATIFDDIRFPEGKIHEDEFVLHKVVEHIDRVSYVDRELYFYRQRDNSIMQEGFSIKRLDCVEALIERYEYLIEKKQKNHTRICGQECIRLAQEAFIRLDLSEKAVKEKYDELMQQYRTANGKYLRQYGIDKYALKFLLFSLNTGQYLKVKKIIRWLKMV